MTNPKQHHYIPETYLENFCNKDGVLWLYDKWDGRSFPSKPKGVLKEHFYYAQPDHERKIWNHNIERFFSEKIEAEWPSTVSLIQDGPDTLKELTHFFMFLYATRVRVPNCRKAVEYSLQQSVRIASSSIRDKRFLDDEREGIAQINKAIGTDFNGTAPCCSYNTRWESRYDCQNGLTNLKPRKHMLASNFGAVKEPAGRTIVLWPGSPRPTWFIKARPARL
jgi:hypothetical protein